jgi:DNA-binding MarR family transcriptional regulator
MQSRAGTDDVGSAVNALRRILQALRISSSTVHDQLGITGAQLFVLQQLAGAPGASLREVAERTLTDQSSVSVVVSRLVDAGHVARRISAADARRTELTLTESGRALVRRAPEPAQRRLVAALRATPVAQLRVAASVLDRVARALSPASEPAPMFFEPPGARRGAARRPKPAPKPRRGRSR